MDVQLAGEGMAKQKKAVAQERQKITGLERLGLRVSAMINHPIAQSQRWVTIHRLDTDGEAEWEEVMGLLAEMPELDLTFNDDESVTVRWELQENEERDDFFAERDKEEEIEKEEAPF
jgi:hypothetical protein